MKREKDIYVKIIDEENIAKAIDAVNKTHRWNYGHKPNRTVLWVESTKPDRIVEIRDIIEHGFIPSNPRRRRIFDQAAWKWRDICEPRLYPDQYIHHAVIQVLTPIMMKGMDRWCCGSIRGRGTHYGARAIKKWMKKAEINKKISFHCSRHTFATMMITLGADIFTTSKLLGHANITTSQIYSKIIDKKKVEAVNLVDNLFTTVDKVDETATQTTEQDS